MAYSDKDGFAHIILGKLPVVVVIVVLGCVSLSGCASAPVQEKKDAEVVWPLPPDEPRIKYITSYSGSGQVEKKEAASFFKDVLLGTEEDAGKGLAKPYGVAVDKEGRLYVADTDLGKVAVFDFVAKKFRLLGEEGLGVLSKPAGVAVDSQGRVFVTDVQQDRGIVFDKTGKFMFAVGKKGALEQPVGIALNERLDRVYIVDTKKHNVNVFSMKDGEFLFDFGERGFQPGEFNFPTNVVVGPDNKVYVMDTLNFRVQVFDADGKFVFKFGEVGDGYGRFSKPKGIALDSDGHIYVTDAAFNNIQIFDPQGQLLLFFSNLGAGRGENWGPAGMFIDDKDRIYVADQYNRRVNVYQYVGGKVQPSVK